MNARTIQHPGIEIREIDMTEYTTTVTTNNAYVMGFADKGPIYDYSWITTQSEFISLYGQPQTEAEKYLYYAVQSILDNGGTPIVARMPYDNKQCKAYKALKIKYASVIDDPESDYGFTLLDWENTASFSNNANPLIELDKVGSYIQPEGFVGIYETLQHQDLSLKNFEGIQLNELDLNSITYRDLLLSLNTELANTFDLSNDEPVMLINKSLTNISHLEGYLDQSAHNKSVGTFVGLPNFSSSSGLSANFSKLINELSKYCTGNSGVIKTVLSGLYDDTKTLFDNAFPSLSRFPSSSILELTKKLDTIDATLSMSAEISGNADLRNYKFYTQIKESYITYEFNPIKTVLTSSMFNDTISGFLPELTNRLNAALNNYTIFKKNGGNDTFYTYQEKIDNLTKIQSYVTANTDNHDKTVSAIIKNFGTETAYTLNSKIYTNSKLEHKLSNYSLASILRLYGNATKLDTFVSCPPDLYAYCKELYDDDNYIFNTVIPSGYPSAWLEIFKQDIRYQMLETDSGEYKHIIVNGEDPNDLLIPSSVLLTYFDNDKIKGYITEPISPATTIAAEIATDTANNNMEAVTKYEFLKETSQYLAAIYNNPYFKKFDDDNDKDLYHQAIIDAHLLTTPEINYTHAVYLDSRECELSNEQYDDLVTTNNFTKKDLNINRYGEDIDDANFVIVDKQKSIVAGTGGNEGYFVTIVDPFDALKMQRMLVNPAAEIVGQSTISSDKTKLRYYAGESEYLSLIHI